MSHRLFPVQDSTLSADALAEKLPVQYALPGIVQCRFFRKGICDTYRVFAGDQRFYLKVYKHGRRNQTDVTEEVRLLNHLAADGVSVAKPVMRNDGQYVSHIAAPEGERYTVLFESAPGTLGHDGDPRKISAFGRMVGRMHESLDSFPLPYRRNPLDVDHLVTENMQMISSLMQHRPDDLALIASIAEACKGLALLKTRRKPEFGVCHGDLHGGDVCYDEYRNPTLFDFDSSGCGWRALDIGVFLASVDRMDTAVEAENRRQRQLMSFLEGYSRVRNLTTDEVVAVQNTPPIRHIFLMGFVLRYTAMQQGDHWANEQFIDWHMKWFKSWVKMSD